jgi:LacI family transcriptional regulator
MSLNEVAKRSGVSAATVSRVVNGVAVVKSSTRARVMKAVLELKYHPNLHARSLAGGRSRTIGVIVSNLDNPFFLDIYRAVENDCHAHNYEVLVASTAYSSERLMSSVKLMIGRRVAGLER